MSEQTKAGRLAAKLDGMVSAKVLPGLLPIDISAAAELLREQDAELKSLRAALATKRHIVNATATREHYRLKIRGEFVIADPLIYFGEIAVDDRTMFAAADREWEMHVARRLTHAATADWIRGMEERAYVAVRKAVASADTRPEGGDSTKIEAPFTGGAVPHEDAADAQPTPVSDPISNKGER